MIYVCSVIIAIVAYLLGSVNTSIILSKLKSGKDIRSEGSGNAGATNMLRTHGKLMGAMTLVCDILKGILAVALAGLLSRAAGDHAYILRYIAAVFVVLGHDFPVFFGFRGGKGVATSLGVALVLDWRVGLIVLAGALLIMVLTRYVSLGSVAAALLYVVATIIKMVLMHSFNLFELICAVVLSGLLIFRHKENIKRLIAGTENKLGQKKTGGKAV